jgi:protein farnesyltransferase/geranylgeranyltransferase type-1 subunit alpha
VTPIRQDDGPLPLAKIRYPPGFEEVHDYFRAIREKGELSERALDLTADVIKHNSANYTAWYYRRRCITEIHKNLKDELEFTDEWARDSPKNYQVWYHRRWLIAEMTNGLSADEGKTLGQSELEYHFDVMQVNDDYKNYNGWSHRLYIVRKFDLWNDELRFVENLLRDDVRNNSAWNHRFTIVRNTCWPLTEEIVQRELAYTLDSLRSCANNESAWNYLSAFLGDGEGKIPWDAHPAVEAFCQEACAASPESPCRFAVEALAHIHRARGQLDEALRQYQLLMTADAVRSKYWEWQGALLTQAKASRP